jgi:hypothetical protein
LPPQALNNDVLNALRDVSTIDAGGCQLTISQPLVDLKRNPGIGGYETRKVPMGRYAILDHRWMKHINPELFAKIRVGEETGWVRVTTWSVSDRSGNCP